MDFLFANPIFTWLLPAAGLPVIFHLFFKLKKRPRVFPTLMFFEQIDPKLSARRQIRQWLVLLLRMLFIFFLLLALAHPMWLIGGGTGSVAVVCVIDNSGSMSGPSKGDRSKLSAASEAARSLVANLAAKDTAGVLTLVDDPTVTLPSGLNSDKTPIKAALDKIVDTEATGEPAAALQRAFALLETSSATRFEVDVFTDLQEAKWNRPGALKPPRAGTTITVHRFPTAAFKLANVSLMGTVVPQRHLIAGRPLALQVALANHSDLDAAVHLNWVDDADNKGTIELSIPPQSEKNASILVKPATAGIHWLKMWVEGAAFDADNKAGMAFICSDKSPVLFLGQANDFGLLPLAVSPAGEGAMSGLAATYGTVADLERLKPIMVVTSWDAVERDAPLLRPFVEQGGNLLVVPGLTATAQVQVPDWLGATCEAVESQPKGAAVMIERANSPMFADLRNDSGQVPFRAIKAFKFQPLRPANDQETIFGLDDGRALLAETKLGKGYVFASGLAFDPSWTTLPLKGSFLAIAQGMALAHSDMSRPIMNLVAGEHLPVGGTESVQIKSLAGSPLDWRGDGAHLPALPRAGVYSFKTGQAERYLAVRSSDKEGLAKFITGDQVPVLAGVTHRVKDFIDLESFLKQAIKMSRGLDLFLPLLLMAVLMLLLEAWVANPLPRKLKSSANVAAATRRPAGVA